MKALLWMILGALIGGSGSLLFAKRAGSKLREKLADSANPIMDFVKEGVAVDKDVIASITSSFKSGGAMKDMFAKAESMAGEGLKKAKEMGSEALHKATEGVEHLAEKGKELAHDAVEKGKELAHDTAEKGKEVAEKATDAVKTVAEKAEDMVDGDDNKNA